ncbi:MAG: hypothetical protein OXU54_08200 [Gammaproteobacteria bacterium]|nr:hypothetical protein [Gammaproteobacteria bacterium]
MSRQAGGKALIVLVADQDMAQTVKGLLGRWQSLGIAPVKFEVRRHHNRDGGCRVGATQYLRPFLGNYRHALVVFDFRGSGTRLTREKTQEEVEKALRQGGWEDRAKAIVIEPELEAWVWAASEKVPEILGWKGEYSALKHWLHKQDLWPNDNLKPPDPKTAMERTMRESRSRRTSRKFYELASAVKLEHCRDPAFNELKKTLQAWFPP